MFVRRLKAGQDSKGQTKQSQDETSQAKTRQNKPRQDQASEHHGLVVPSEPFILRVDESA
jgi:hypothetical protein